MSFQFNSDKEQIRGVNPSIIGSNSVRFKAGSGSDEREIIQARLDPSTGLPRVGINRTGRKVNAIKVLTQGSGYTDQPTINISTPTLSDGVQAVASATVTNGRITSILIDNPGDGYEFAPTVTIVGGNGNGATAQSELDTIDYELDINGAIRTSTSIISDTANILNLDIDNLVTPDIKHRAPHLKTYANGVGVRFPQQIDQVNKNEYYYEGGNVYQILDTGLCGPVPPFHTDGIELNGEVRVKHIGYRVNQPSFAFYGEGGDAGVFPRSITPQLGDNSDKIATTEYVLNLATNDVGGRIYVSQLIGDDNNDGRSPVNPVRTIKKACQLAWQTPGVKESIIVAGGEYIEDNPISIPPDASVVGDNLRLVIIRPQNVGKHIFKFGDKNYVIGVTYQDQVNQQGQSTGTFDFAMVFDDKQRITYDTTVNGDFGTSWEVGHQFFGPQKYNGRFSFNGGLDSLVAGTIIRGVTSNVLATIGGVTFDSIDPADQNRYQTGSLSNLVAITGGFSSAETFWYGGNGTTRWLGQTVVQLGDIIWAEENVYEVTAVTGSATTGTILPTHTNGAVTDNGGEVTFTFLRAAYQFVGSQIKSTRAEGEVVFSDDDNTTELPIVRVDFSLQGTFTDGFQNEIYGSAEDLGGVVFYTNILDGANNIHDFKEGEEIEIIGMPSAPDDLTFLNGKQRIYKVYEDADGRARRFVIPKKIPVSLGLNAEDEWIPETVGAVVSVRSASKSVTLSLLNSPNKFPIAQPVARRYQDACLQIRNNIDFIADEVVGRINDEFKKEYFSVYGVSGNTFKIYLGTSRFVHSYVSGGTVTFGSNTYNISNFVYDNDDTGEVTITTATNAGLSEDDTVKLAGIVVECTIDGVVTQKTYPSFNIPVSDQKCRRDIGHFLNALIRDLEFGSNYNIIGAAKKYLSAGQIDYVDYEIIQTVRAIEYARELAIYAMCKWRTGNRLTDPVYSPQYTTLDAYIDPTVIDDTLGSPACANVEASINTLSYLFVDVLANNASGTYLDAAYLIARNKDFIADEAYLITKQQYPSLGLNDVDERKCRRDINYILNGVLRDLVLGGNTGSVNAAEFYYSGTTLVGVPQSELGATRYAFEKVRDLSILAMRNWYTNGGAGAQYTPLQSIIPLFTDNTILTDPAGTPWCAAVETSLTTSFGLIDGILEYADDNTSPTAIQPGTTTRTTGTLYTADDVISYPENVLRDSNNNYITIRSADDDFPIISASPYTQNSSIISKIGGSGALIDGSKVKSPNCPFPGLTDGKATFPNQGKSMVASAFTIVSEQNGIGYKIIEDGYVQLVSVFCIFTVDGILAESGGYASVTNSASNFGLYSLRATGYRKEAYEFDAGYTDGTQGYLRSYIDVVGEDVSGFTELTLDNLGRIPLEHYILKIDGLETADGEEQEYYVLEITKVLREGPPYRVRLTITDGSGAGEAEFVDSATGLPVTVASLATRQVSFHRPSIVNSSSHTWEYVGSGTTYEALPENGGQKITANEQVSQDYGRVYVSGTDELGDFKVGTFASIENRTGNISFTGTVNISEVNFLKLKGGDVTITGFDDSNTLGGSTPSDEKLPTQKAVKDYITNNLGQYINKNYSTNPVPRALVELTDSGLISENQLPATSPIEVYSVATEADRLALEGLRAGDIAIEDGTAYILNTDSDSLFLGIAVDTSLQFTANGILTGSVTGGKIQLTEYREGVVSRINVDENGGGSGYSTSSPPTVVITDDGTQAGHVAAVARAVVANGEVVAIELIESQGYIGGKGYTSVPTISFTNTSGGSGASATAVIESRLYGDIVNSIKLTQNDTIQSNNSPAETVNVARVINTSGSDAANWVSLSTTTVSADDITGGPIPTGTLATNSTVANSNTALFGDQSYKKVVKSLRETETRYFIKTIDVSGTDYLLFLQASDNNTSLLLEGHEVVNVTGVPAGTTIVGVSSQTVGTDTYKRVDLSNSLTSTVAAGTIIEFVRPASPVLIESLTTTADFIESVQIENGGQDFAQDDGGTFNYNNVPIGGGGGSGLELNFIIVSGVVTRVTVANGGSGYENDFTIQDIPTEIGTEGSGLILRAKVNQVDKKEGDIGIDIARVTSSTLSDEVFGTVGVARFNKNQFDIGANGSVQLFTGRDSGLDADLLDGNQSDYYRNATNINAGTLGTAYLSSTETYNISISQQSGSTEKLTAKVGSLTTDLVPNEINSGASVEVRRNDANQLFDPAFDENGQSTATDYNTVLSIRGGGTSSQNPYGGVTQIAFTDGNNLYVRGSSGSVASDAAWSSWAKLWSSANDYNSDPADSRTIAGPDAYRLRGRTGLWYQNAFGINYGTLSDNRLPKYQSQKDIKDRLRILENNTAGARFSVYIGTVNSSIVNKLNSAPFTSEPPVVDIVDIDDNFTGELTLSDIRIYNNDGSILDQNSLTIDYTQVYAVVTGTLSDGTFNGGTALGPDNVNGVPFDDFTISTVDANSDGMPDGNYQVISLESDGGEAKMVLGRATGVANSESTPAIWFRSSATIPADAADLPNFYTAAITASGGGSGVGSGALNVSVAGNNSFTINNNTAWNAGNVSFTVSNVGSSYSNNNADFNANDPDASITLKNAVIRDLNGDFTAGTITANLTGTASGNLELGGGTLTGNLNIGTSGAAANLDVWGTTTLRDSVSLSKGITVDTNVFVVDATNDRIGVGTSTPSVKFDLYQRTNTSASTTGTTLLKLTNDVRNFADPAVGDLQQQKTFIDFNFVDDDSNGVPQVRIGAEVGQNADADNRNKEGSGAFVVYTGTGDSVSSNVLTEKLRVSNNGYTGILNATPQYPLDVTGVIHSSSAVEADQSISIGESGDAAAGSVLIFEGSSNDVSTGGRNFRIANSISVGQGILEISTSTANGTTTWTTAQSGVGVFNAPALAITSGLASDGVTESNQVAINTAAFTGTDNSDPANPILRRYALNIGGDMNLSGQLFQNNEPFVTSRWTEASNATDIYRLSKVGVNTVDPSYTLEVSGGMNIKKNDLIPSEPFTDTVTWTQVGNVVSVGTRSITYNGDGRIWADLGLQNGTQYTLQVRISTLDLDAAGGSNRRFEIRNGTSTAGSPLVLRVYSTQATAIAQGQQYGGAGYYSATFTATNSEIGLFGLNLSNNNDVAFDSIIVYPVGDDGILRINGDPMWLDSYGIIRASRSNIEEDVTIPTGTNAVSTGPIEINSGNTVTIDSNAVWTIL